MNVGRRRGEDGNEPIGDETNPGVVDSKRLPLFCGKSTAGAVGVTKRTRNVLILLAYAISVVMRRNQAAPAKFFQRIADGGWEIYVSG